MIAKALDPRAELSSAALAVEFFHTASLIADDLPCMDNDDLRRGEPSLHKKFNENTALLASYALISEGYALLAAQLPSNLLPLTLQNAAFNTGILGASGGQYLDLYLASYSLPALTEVIVKKTVSLFEIAFVFGWLYGGGAPEKLPLVKKAAYHFGMAFQIADYLADLAQDSLRQNPMNLALLLSPEKAKEMFHEETNSFTELLSSLDLAQSDLAIVITLLRQPSL
jgi:geranylgeranyl diphosphate synthase type II